MSMNPELTVASPPPDPATWRGVRQLIVSDMDRMASYFGGGDWRHRLYWSLLPNFQAVMWYRIYRCLMLRRRVGLARVLALVSLYFNRTELSPTASIGPACLITHTGASFYGTAGARLTMMGSCGAGPWGGRKDVGAGVGNPLIGDDVVLAQLCVVLGPVRIGNGARIGPGTVVMRDVPPGAVVVAAKARIQLAGEQEEAPR